MSWLSTLLGRVAGAEPDTPTAFTAPLAPAERLAVIGDVHGCESLLVAMLEALSAVDPPPDRLVFVGDLIDRGEDSAGVLDLMREIELGLGDQLVVLRGNHEAMMLAFLDSPETAAARWLRYGGLQTLASFGIGDVTETMSETKALKLRDGLAAALGPELIAWLRTRPTAFTSGNVTIVHAGADPGLPIAEQSDDTLVWGHPAFRTTPRADGQWVVHGHTVVDEVAAVAGRIDVDTGAFATGRLSAALIEPGRMTPISVRQ